MKKKDTAKKGGKKAFGTREWAAVNVNIQTGCEHDCLYCYAKCMGIRFGRTATGKWKTPRLRRNMVEKGYRKRRGTIMFPTTHDITQANLDACLVVLKKMLAAGNDLLVVSKPHLECVKRLCNELDAYKNRILFRFTIGSADATVLSFWEPHAPAYVELDEGPRMFTNIVDCDLDTLKIGQKVKLVFKPTEEGGAPVPMFTPV